MTQDRLELVGMGRSAEIEVVGTPVQQQVTHGAAHQRQLVPASREQVSKFNGFRPNFEIHTRPFHKYYRFYAYSSIPLPHLHTVLSKVEVMITPADLARMLAHAAGDHTQNPLEPDTLLYTSEAPRTPKTVVRPPEPRFPTPAMMPQRRAGDGPTTFASLDAQELPVVREYSAGGLVFDERGRVAIIARHSRNGHLEWCLPKGHIEKGETPQQTAVREVHEETGILGEVVESIATIDYWFTGTSQRVHKLVHHFALRQIGGDLTVEGDPDHEAEDAIWVDFDDLDDVLSYPNERKIAWLYARKMKQG